MQKNLTNVNNYLTLNSKNYQLRKFRIVELLDNLPHLESKELKKLLPNALGVTRQTFSNWCNAHLDSDTDIPFSRAYRISLVLGIPVLELLNKQYFKKSSITPRLTSINDFKKVTGLTN